MISRLVDINLIVYKTGISTQTCVPTKCNVYINKKYYTVYIFIFNIGIISFEPYSYKICISEVAKCFEERNFTREPKRNGSISFSCLISYIHITNYWLQFSVVERNEKPKWAVHYLLHVRIVQLQPQPTSDIQEIAIVKQDLIKS